MRSSVLLLVFLAACSARKGEPPPGKNENTDYLVSLEGIGPVKTGMSQAELEKALQQKVPLSNPADSGSGSWVDSATIRYKEAELRLGFVRTYAYADPDSFHMRVTGMVTASPLCRTAGGIGIGSGKQEIINAFEQHQLYLGPGFDNDTDTVRSKTLYSIRAREAREGPEIVFYLKNNKVYSIEVGAFYDDSE